MKLLGIDQGTTGTRACIVDAATGQIEKQAYAPHAQHLPRPGWVEHDANEIWACTQRVIAGVIDGVTIDGVAIANQGETCLVWDAATGAPLHRALVWQDGRTADAIDQLAHREALVRARTGLRLDPYFAAPKLRWLLDHTRRDGVRAGTLDSWLLERLTGTFATDTSTAARTLLCDTQTGAWDHELCALFGVPRAVLPEIRDTDGGFGTCIGNGLAGVPVVASVVDQPAALMGQGGIDRGDAKATFGTGCFVYVNTGDVRVETAEVLATVAWRRDGRTTYALDGGVLAVGSAFGWLRELGLAVDLDTLGPRRDPDVVCVPALVGLGAPHWDRSARAAWLGMSSRATRDDLAHALVDGVCCRVAEVIEATERAAGIRIAELRVDGGLTRSRHVMQRQADLLGRPILVAEDDEATAIGACLLAALRLGAITVDAVRARRDRTGARYEPRADGAATRARFAAALGAVRAFR